MRESARTVQEAGFEPIMTRAIADKGWEEGWIAPEIPAKRTGKRIAVVGVTDEDATGYVAASGAAFIAAVPTA